MRLLITGAGGFVGNHLAAFIGGIQPEASLTGTTLFSEERVHPAVNEARQIDLKDYAQVRNLLADCRPDAIYHLAAQAFVPRSFEDPWETLENNIRAQLNIITACLELAIRPRTLIVSSAEIYGAVSPEQLPLDEGAAIRPANPYSVSKVAQDMLALQYYLSHDLPIMRARPFNHIGPGQNSRFVAPAFAMQIAGIEEASARRLYTLATWRLNGTLPMCVISCARITPSWNRVDRAKPTISLPARHTAFNIFSTPCSR